MCVYAVSLTGVQALGDRGRLDQVTSTQVTGDEMVKVFHQVLPSCSSHVWSFLARLRQDTDQESELQLKGKVTFELWKSQSSIHNNEEWKMLQLQACVACYSLIVDEGVKCSSPPHVSPG